MGLLKAHIFCLMHSFKTRQSPGDSLNNHHDLQSQFMAQLLPYVENHFYYSNTEFLFYTYIHIFPCFFVCQAGFHTWMEKGHTPSQMFVKQVEPCNKDWIHPEYCQFRLTQVINYKWQCSLIVLRHYVVCSASA